MTKRKLTLFHFLVSMFLLSGLSAQTGEDCANVITIPYSSDTWCGIYDNVGATTDVSQVTFDPLGLSCPIVSNEVWFAFQPVEPLFDFTITVTGIADGGNPAMMQPQITVVRGDCSELEAMACAEAALGENSISLDLPLTSFFPGLTYYILVSDWSATAQSNEGSFNLCVEELVPPSEVNIENGAVYTGCTGTLYDTGGPTGAYSNGENITAEICPNTPFGCLSLVVDYDIETGFDNLTISGYGAGATTPGVLTNLTGTGSGVEVLSEGCVTVQFTSDGSVTDPGFSIVWECQPGTCFDLTGAIEDGTTYTDCDGTIYDTGGMNGNYTDNQNISAEICPSDPFECITVTVDYDTEPGADDLNIYGWLPAGTGQTLLGSLSGSGSGVEFLSEGCVTVEFISDGSVTGSGFAIDWTCSDEPCFGDFGTGCPAVSALVSDPFICQGECVDLTAVPVAGYETTDYTVEQIGYSPYPFNVGTPVFNNIDDQWSDPIGLPFNFCFYGGTYNQITIGTNGVVSFDMTYAGNYNAWPINQAIPGNPDILNSITCPFHDIDPGGGGDIFFAIYGEVPCRAAVISFNNVPMFSCGDPSTQQIVLYENTNIIETYIFNKPLCVGWNDGAAIHGIQDASGTQAVWVPGRNYPDQWTANNDAWRFLPAGAPDFTTIWYEVGNPTPIGTDNVLTDICPAATTSYYAETTYGGCAGASITVADTVMVEVGTEGVFPYEILPDSEICLGESVAIGGTATADVTYTWTSDPTDPTLDLTDPANPVATPVVTTTYTLNAVKGGCDITDQVTITVVDDPTPTITGVLEICPGVSTTLDAGTGYMGYAWSTSETTQQISVDVIGDYTVTVTLASGCTGEATVTVTAASGMSAEVVSTVPVSCSPPNGAIITNVTSGVAPYTYDWTGDAAGQGGTATELTAGDYTVTVTDAAGCSTVLNATVDELPPVVASVDKDTVCIGELIQLSATGGDGNYLWSPETAVSDPNSATPTANPTETTTYYVSSITNTENLVVNGDFENGDTDFTTTYLLGANIGGTWGDLSSEGTYGIYTSPNIGHSNYVSCGDHTSGTGNMLVVNGSATANQNIWCQTVLVTPNSDYNFSTWVTSVVGENPAQLQFSINGELIGGSLNLTSATCFWEEFSATWNSGDNTFADICITNQNTGGSGNDFAIDDISFATFCELTDSVTVYVSQPEALVIAATDDFCNTCQGTLTASANGGFGSYTYQWDDAAAQQTTPTAGNLCGDAGYTVTVTDEYGCSDAVSGYVLNAGTNIPVEIMGDLLICPGTSTPLEAGPVAFDSYEWSTNETTAFIVVQPGTYTVTVTSSGTCTGSATVVVEEAPLPMPTITGSDEICLGESTDLDAGAGYAAYSWSNGSDFQVITVTDAGDYTVTVTDAEGCQGTTSFTLNVAQLSLEITGDTELCVGDMLMLSANTEGAVFWYDSNNNLLGTNPILAETPTAAGVYTYTVQAQDNSCSLTETVTVTISETPMLMVSEDTEICLGASATLTASTDVGSLSWAPANEFADPTAGTQTVSPLSSTTYVVTADNNGCIVQEEVTVSMSDAPVYDVVQNQNICLGGAVTLGTLLDANTSYSWTSVPADPSLANPSSAMPSVSPTVTTTYTLTATSSDGCVETQSVTISVVEPTISVAPTTICQGDVAVLNAVVSPAGGTVTWLDWEGNVLGTGEQLQFSPWGSGTYAANYEVNGCSELALVDVTVIEIPNITLSANPGTEINPGMDVTITASGVPAGSTYSWVADNDNNPEGNDVINVTPTVTTTYTLTVTSPEGCIYTASITIVVIPLDFTVPNAFTPNSDGTNDLFYPIYDDLSLDILEFKVFDRWGQIVHDRVDAGWDGRFKDALMPSDIYVYFVRVRYSDGTEETRKGDVALIR